METRPGVPAAQVELDAGPYVVVDHAHDLAVDAVCGESVEELLCEELAAGGGG